MTDTKALVERAQPPSRIRLVMGRCGVRIWTADDPLPATFDGEEVHEYVAASAVGKAEQRTIAQLASTAHAIGWQAGVGGRETAGAIVSYLATSPEEIGPFVAGKLSALDFAGDWIRGGCLTWHAAKGDKIVSPPDIRPLPPAPEQEAGR